MNIKELSIQELSIQELNKTELYETTGGMPWLLAAVLAGFVYDIISDPGSISKGWKAGAAAAQE